MLTFGCCVIFGGRCPAFAAASLLGVDRHGFALKQGTETGVPLVDVDRAAAVAERVADMAVRADRARNLGG